MTSIAAFGAAEPVVKSPEDPKASAAIPAVPPSPVEVLAHGDRNPDWRPDWPTELPPDAFRLHGVRAVREIVVAIDGSSEYAARWDASGAPLERPLFIGEDSYRLSFVRDPAGRPKRYELSGPEGNSAVSVTLAFSEDGSLFSSESLIEGRVALSLFYLLGDALEEVVYDEDGRASSRASFAFSREGLRSAASYAEDGAAALAAEFDYGSDGRITRISTATASAEAVYGDDGLPRSARAVSGASGAALERRFQWDERGLLVRELSFADGSSEETAYVYIFDDAGEWTERRALRYVERFGVRTPERGVLVQRRINYR